MSEFGITVVCITGYATDLDPEIEILRNVFGDNERSHKLQDFYHEINSEIDNALAGLKDEDKKTAYWESIADYSVALYSNAWAEMIVSAGAINIFGDPSLTASTVDPEAIIEADPDIAFKMVTSASDSLSGYMPPEDSDYQLAAEKYSGRPGFSELKCVQEGNVYFVTSFLCGGLGKTMGRAVVAKLLYPELMQDVDVDAMFAEWMDFQNMEHISGHYMRMGDIQ